MEQYAKLIKRRGRAPDDVHFVATSASRDARNRDEFFDGVRRRLGVQPDVITGDKEAQLSFLGALSRVRPAGEPVLVMDIGGGSTELITGSAAGRVAVGRLTRHRVGSTDRALSQGQPAGAR